MGDNSSATIIWACLSFFLTMIISQGLVSLDEKQKELTEYQTNLVNIEKYASDLQTYLTVKTIEKGVETHGTCLQALINGMILLHLC
jgi:hypothetical protein